MELPTAREIELETLVRTRDRQVAELTDELAQLRRSLNTQTSAGDDSLTLPPALVSVLLPHLHTGSASTGPSTSHGTVAESLTQKARLLQEENDELYDLLRHGETGKLKDEVRGLRRLVEKLEDALRESHSVITTLSAELDKTNETFMASARPTLKSHDSRSYSRSPTNSYNPLPGHSNDSSKLPPTGPRAHKKPRISDVQSPPRPSRPNGPSSSHTHRPSSSYNGNRGPDSRGFKSRGHGDSRGKANNHANNNNNVKMDVEEVQLPRAPTSPRQDRGRDRDIDRDFGREREKDRRGGERNRGAGGENVNGPSSANGPRERNDRDRGDRERHKIQKRNGHYESRGANRGGRRHERGQPSVASNDSATGDRTLAERMGL